jgi:tetratricopeptide (TPR) repeat protein
VRARVAALVLAALAGGAITVAAPAEVAAAPAEELARARDAFRQREFDAAIPLLNYLLYPSPRLARPADLIEAHVLLGVCHLEVGDSREAKREFESALFIDSAVTLDPLLFSEKAIEAFDETKEKFEADARKDEQIRLLAQQRDLLRQALERSFVEEKRPFLFNFVPFGAGQFQMGRRRWGMFFAVSQGVTGAVWVASTAYLLNRYGYRGRVPREEVGGARTMQGIELIAGSACLLSMIGGIAHALWIYEPAQRRPLNDEELQKLLDDNHLGAEASAGASGLSIGPTFYPEGGGGVTLSWEY